MAGTLSELYIYFKLARQLHLRYCEYYVDDMQCIILVEGPPIVFRDFNLDAMLIM